MRFARVVGVVIAATATTAGCGFPALEAIVDARVDPDASRVCYGASNGLVTPCFDPAPSGDITLPSTIDTTNSPLCSTVVMDVPAGLCVIAGEKITVASGTVAVIGDKPLVLVAASTISISGTLDAASHRSTTNPAMTVQIGAGADPAGGCNLGMIPGASCGGAGGTFFALGGAGGYGDNGPPVGNPGQAQTNLSLRGGCRGQDGSNAGGSGGGRGLGGHGGGALYLIASTIFNEGTINASGEGGAPGRAAGNSPAGGGGSGGLIGLDAPTITNTGVVLANGGGGGEGADGPTSGFPGLEPTGVTPAAGGISVSNGGNGGTGGAGGTGGGNANGGNGQNATADGGGGGGGGTGVIKVYRGTLTGQYSPVPTP